MDNVAWLRPDSGWASRLPQLELEWETLSFLGVAIVFSTLMSVGFRGAAAARPNLKSDEMESFRKLTQRLGIYV
jgi:hypothetical protein